MNRILSFLFKALVFSIPVIIFPAIVYLEFRENDRWIFYFQLYPHLILFSLLAFGVVLVNLHQASALIRRRSSFFRNCCIMIVISVILTFVETTSNNMMLLELNNQAQSTIELSRTAIKQIQQIPDNIIDVDRIINGNQLTISKENLGKALINFRDRQTNLSPEQKQGYYTFMKKGLSFSTWKKQNNVFSTSRIFYILSFFIITSVSLIFWPMLVIYERSDIRDYHRYLKLLTISFLVFMLWIPLRYYYNLLTLNLVFGNDYLIGSWDLFAFLIYPVYGSLLAWKNYQNRPEDFRRIFLIAIAIFLVIFGIVFPHIIPNIVTYIFGINSDVLTWGILLIPSIVYYGYQIHLTSHQ